MRTTAPAVAPPRRRSVLRPRFTPAWVGATALLLIVLPCLLTLPWSVGQYEKQFTAQAQPPSLAQPLGTDYLGRSQLWRCLIGGAISLGVGACAAGIAVVIGVAWGALAGYVGGRVDSCLMRFVDVMYGLPYVLLVVLVNIAIKPAIVRASGAALSMFGHDKADVAGAIGDVLTILIAIGGVSWLTMARVIRGQVLSLRGQPFIEAARALGLSPVRVFTHHLMPNLVGPIVVYATLAVPSAILQESFLSFLGIGVQPPLPTWGRLAADALGELHNLSDPGMTVRWWLLFWPCALLGLTLLSLNFLGDALRRKLDSRWRSVK